MSGRDGFWLVLLALITASSPAEAVLVVEAVDPHHAADRAGVRAGDRLISWSRAGAEAGGDFDCPFEVDRVEQLETARGPVRVHLRRDARRIDLDMPPDRWGLHTRPTLDAADVELHRRGLEQVEGSPPATVPDPLATLVERWAREGRHCLAAWLLGERARRVDAGSPDGLEKAYRLAIDQAARGGERHAQLELQRALADRLIHAGRPQEALRIMAAMIQEPGAGEDAVDPLHHGLLLVGLGELHRQLGEPEPARRALERAFAILEVEAAESYPLAICLRSLAILHFVTGDLEAGEEIQLRALELLGRIAPQSRGYSQLLTNQANLAFRRGDLKGAQELYEKSYQIRHRLSPDDRDSGAILANLATLAMRRGDLFEAERHATRALEVQQIAGSSPKLISIFGNLGQIALARGDLAAAERWTRRALALQETLAIEDSQTVTLLATLSWATAENGDTAQAEELFARAVDQLRQGERNLDLATALGYLARVRLRQGNEAAAWNLLREALAIEEERVPESLAIADTLRLSGRLAAARGDRESAERYLERALAIQRRAAPRTLAEARTLHALATIFRSQGRLETSRQLLAEAVAIFDLQARSVGADYETAAELRARNHDLYFDYLRVLIESGRPADAFHVLERSRLRAFLDILAMRDLSFAADLPADLDLERRRTNAVYDEALRALMAANDPEEMEGLRAALERARADRERVRTLVRQQLPRLADLESPRPLDLEAASEILGPGTVLLSYAVSEAQTYLFVVGPEPGDLAVHALGAGAERLREEVLRLRAALVPSTPIATVEHLARRSSSLLLGKAAGPIARAERIAISADGPLHDLPFAVLADPSSGEFRHLIEARPLIGIDSVTTLDQLRSHRGCGPESTVVAFGDPLYPAAQGDAAGPRPRSRQVVDGLELSPLPASRQEVVQIADLYPRTSRVYLGERATEEHAKAVPRQTCLLHFASHAFADGRFPLESAIALSVPIEPSRADNGLLQAWEIFEQVRVDADLVTLSGCDTAGGKDLAGEGRIGLVRAFQYAGAQTVVASLWKVADRGALCLMKRFYERLHGGAVKDEALRQAQLDLLANGEPGCGHPYFWAAFQMLGDWQ